MPLLSTLLNENIGILAYTRNAIVNPSYGVRIYVSPSYDIVDADGDTYSLDVYDITSDEWDIEMHVQYQEEEKKVEITLAQFDAAWESWLALPYRGYTAQDYIKRKLGL